jgi:hypothetical protein
MSSDGGVPARRGDGREPALAYVPSDDPGSLWGGELGPDRVGWRPTVGEQLWRQILPWRCERTTARLGGDVVAVVELTNGVEPAWDWRTVSFWTAALGPAWRVHLRHAGRLDLISPSERPPGP